MLKLRVIPCLDVKDGRVVKGVNFVALRDAGDPVEQAAVYDAAGADELTFLDITASHENRDTILDVVSRTAARVFLPLTVGGGIRSHRGHARACCWPAPTSAASTPPPWRGRNWCARRRRNSAASASWSRSMPSRPRRDGGRCSPMAGGAAPASTRSTGAAAWSRSGAGEILLTSMDRDGTGRGFDLDLLRAVCGAVRVPVIASGGVGTLRHFVEGARAGATGLLAASVFHFGTFTIAEVKAALAAAGLPVRLPRAAA